MFTMMIRFGTPAFDEALALRNDILRVPLGMVFDVKDIQIEYRDFHFGVYNEGFDLVACLTMRPLADGHIKMRQVAVRADLQRTGLGSHLVRFSETWAQRQDFNKIILHARDEAVAFYKRMNYNTVGKAFLEVGIQHYFMEKKLTKNI